MAATTASKTVIIPDAYGVHAKPAMMFAEVAGRFGCDVVVSRTDGDAEPVDAKSLLGMLTLALTQGTEIEICATGVDAASAVDALVRLVESSFRAT